MESYLDTLNDAQRAPVLQQDGPMIVVAGAGSGKTRVLTFRIAHLMHRGVDPFQILALTFTNKAAREMKKRIAAIVGTTEAKNLWMGTFHSVFAKILRIEADKLGFPTNFTIYDAQDAQRLVATIIKEMALDKEVYKFKQVYARISSFKNNLITVNSYFQNPELIEADAMAKRPRMGDVYKQYVLRCFKAGAMDFDDLLLRTNELLNRFPDVLSKYQHRFRYILVDEYQDTNHSQYLIVRALADKFENICVVGDDAQSIYAFRGANINNILHFQRDYENVKEYRLEQNYRSTANIVKAANSIIDKNQTKLDKVIWTANDSGNKISVNQLVTDGEEGRFVASTILENQMQKQLKNSDFAVLYRTNAQSRAVEDALRKKDIPYQIYGGLSFYQRKEIKDVLAYLRLITNPKDEEALKRVINYPIRGIGTTTIDKLSVAANQYDKSIFEIIESLDQIDIKITKSTQRKLEDFRANIQSFAIASETIDAFEITKAVIRKTALVQELKKDSTPEGVSRIENIEELLNGIKDFVEEQKQIAGTTGSLSEFLEDVALATDLDKHTADTDRVALMTIHLAKGLEFPHVFIVGLEENLFPSAMSLNTRSELEEERRLFYVALTRAEQQAYLSYCRSRYRWGKSVDADPSRFIEEIDPEYLEFKTPKPQNTYRPVTAAAKFNGEIDKSKLRLKKPKPASPPTPASILQRKQSPKIRKLRSLQDNSDHTAESTTASDQKIELGTEVSHERFGKGKIVKVEGVGVNKKVAIQFEQAGLKKILLRFTKLKLAD